MLILMRDQASTLRNLIQRHSTEEPVSAGERARVIAFTSGKGGVGKSNLALNVAVAMAQSGVRVCLLDANPGSSNIDVLCGLNSYWNFGHVLTGAKSLGEVILKGPAGINIVAAASRLLEPSASPELAEQIAVLETGYDVLVVDAGTGSTETARQFAAVADVTFLVTTPEPTAIADAYATLKAWQGSVSTMPEVIVNRAESAAQAKQILDRFTQTAATFLRLEIPPGRFVAEDATITNAVLARQPFVCLNTEGAAARDVRTIAKQLLAGAKPVRKISFLERLAASDFAG
jgi:flagellar biosynthesis protein FlhG